MKVLVTGGAGFIGSHLAEALCQRGAKVVVVDDLSLGRMENLAWRQAGHDLEFVQGNAGDDQLLRRILPGCVWVFHEAALPSVPRSIKQPLASHEQNVDATLRLLIAARDLGIERFVFASSSSIYGDAEISPKHEQLPPNPLSPYALQKYSAEKYGQLFQRLYGLPTVALRYFNVFGPRQAPDSPYSGVIAKFCTALLQGQRPTIFGDGKQARDFTYIDNAVAANLLAAEAPAERVAGQVFNVAGGESVSLLQLLDELNRLTGQKIEPHFEPARIGDVRNSLADIRAARAEFAYEPTVHWRAGLERTLEFYRQAPAPLRSAPA